MANGRKCRLGQQQTLPRSHKVTQSSWMRVQINLFKLLYITVISCNLKKSNICSKHTQKTYYFKHSLNYFKINIIIKYNNAVSWVTLCALQRTKITLCLHFFNVWRIFFLYTLFDLPLFFVLFLRALLYHHFCYALPLPCQNTQNGCHHVQQLDACRETKQFHTNF